MTLGHGDTARLVATGDARRVVFVLERSASARSSGWRLYRYADGGNNLLEDFGVDERDAYQKTRAAIEEAKRLIRQYEGPEVDVEEMR